MSGLIYKVVSTQYQIVDCVVFELQTVKSMWYEYHDNM